MKHMVKNSKTINSKLAKMLGIGYDGRYVRKGFKRDVFDKLIEK